MECESLCVGVVKMMHWRVILNFLLYYDIGESNLSSVKTGVQSLTQIYGLVYCSRYEHGLVPHCFKSQKGLQIQQRSGGERGKKRYLQGMCHCGVSI